MLVSLDRAVRMISFLVMCRRRRRSSEQHSDSNRGRFDAEEANGILCIIYHYRICATCQIGFYVTRVCEGWEV